MAACVLVVMPWLARNWVVFGEPVFLRSNFWFEFHLGNYHYATGMGTLMKHPTHNTLQLDKYKRLGELGFVADARQQALLFLRRYPGEFLALTAQRVLSFWDGRPLRYRRTHYEFWDPWMVATLSCLALLGLLLAFYRRASGAGLFALLLLFYPAIFYITYSSTRYRHAIEPELLLLASYFVSGAASYLRLRVRSGSGEKLGGANVY